MIRVRALAGGEASLCGRERAATPGPVTVTVVVPGPAAQRSLGTDTPEDSGAAAAQMTRATRGPSAASAACQCQELPRRPGRRCAGPAAGGLQMSSRLRLRLAGRPPDSETLHETSADRRWIQVQHLSRHAEPAAPR